MSELKAIQILINGQKIDFYFKDEADKVIAELKSQKAQLEDDCAYWKAKAKGEI